MKMGRYINLNVTALTGLLLAAFVAMTPAASADEFKMGLLIPGSATEEGWNRIAYDALLRVEKELGAKISYVELAQEPASFEKAFRDYASQGYDLVLGHGFEFQDAALTVAEEYPDTWFFISSSRIFEDNVVGLNTDSSQPFYLMGVIAAKMGTAAGCIGGMEIPPISEAFRGFINGAHSVNPNFDVSVTYIGNFQDAAAAKEAAVSMISAGADVIVPNADAAGLGGYRAVREADKHVYTFGAFTEATEHAPKNVLANYLADYGQGIVNMARAVKEGAFEPTGNVEFGLKHNDVMQFHYNDQADPAVPSDVRILVEEARAKIILGQVNTLAE